MTRAECNKILEAFDRLWDALFKGQESDDAVADIFGAMRNANVFEIDNADAETLRPFLDAHHKQEIKVGNTRFTTGTEYRFSYLRSEEKCYLGLSKEDDGWIAFLIALRYAMTQIAFSYKRIKLSELYREASDDVQ